jgi:hypothetical protein
MGRDGAPDPRDAKPAKILGRREIDLEAGRAHWAYQPLTRIEPASTSARSALFMTAIGNQRLITKS